MIWLVITVTARNFVDNFAQFGGLDNDTLPRGNPLVGSETQAMRKQIGRGKGDRFGACVLETRTGS